MINPFDISPRLQPIVTEIIKAAEKELTSLLRMPVLLNMQTKDKTLNAEYILELVCEQFGVAPEKLRQKCKKRHTATARHILFYLCHQYCKMSWGEIGDLVNRHRTSAMHGQAVIADLVEVQDSYVMKNLLPVIELIENLTPIP